jgi:hypothetical protein
MEDTPPKQMRARSGEHDIVYYRLDEMRSDIRDMAKKLDAFIEHARSHESDSIRAIERCGRHDEQLKTLQDHTIPIDALVAASPEVAQSNGRLSLWTALGALIAAIASGLMQFIGGGK